MAAIRRGQEALKVELPPTQPQPTTDFPPISALFLIYFDHKAGYTIGWKRALPGLEVEGVVEFKSLPSGLHTVKEDLIYFVHEGHAGLGAFVNAPAAEEQRNASMIAVGIMVPLSYGRLGRCWTHADRLKEIANELVVDTSQTKTLEEFWEKYSARDVSENGQHNPLLNSPSSVRFKPGRSMPTKPRTHGRNRSASDGTALVAPGHIFSRYHPARSLLKLLETFGPLIFPIHRAAIFRKRILMTTHAPVQETCNFVYDLSILSNLPLSVLELLPSIAPPQRLRPLFCIGVHDIPFLEEDLRASKVPSSLDDSEAREGMGSGWIACTTDSILAMKTHLFDILVSLPPNNSSNAHQKVWPKVKSPKGTEIKATQRDLRRYKALHWSLSRHTAPSSASPPASDDDDDEETPQPTLSGSYPIRDTPMLDTLPDTESIIEPLSWSALAYSGFMWWASSGEQRLQSEEEADADAALFSGLMLSPSTPRTPRANGSGLSTGNEDLGAEKEVAVIAYFHRLTTQILSTISDLIDATDDDLDADPNNDDENETSPFYDSGGDDDGDGNVADRPAVYVSSADMARMGLDVWSAADHTFVEDVAGVYFGRRVEVEGGTVDICGVRIC